MKNQMSGLTLIEVLIALAIVGISLTAVIKATSQNIRSTSYLEKKTIAMWVGQQVLNEARVDLLKTGGSSGNQRLSTDMLGREWFWQVDEGETPNKHIKQITVRVFDSEEEESPVVTLESYVYHAE